MRKSSFGTGYFAVSRGAGIGAAKGSVLTDAHGI